MRNDNIYCSTPLNILIIDDSNSDRVQMKAKLTVLDHQVIEADRGHQALEYIEANMKKIDLIILDVQMPDMNGFETAIKIRALETKHKQEWHPIIFLSGYSDAEMIEKGIDAGGDDYLTKPINTIVLKAKIVAMQRIADMRQRLVSAKKQLEIQANTDELTNIPNLRHFKNILNKEINRASRFDTPLSIVYMDLDHFKKINDTYGHQAGDIVLKSITNELVTNLRSIDSIGRIGGEEFCLCLPGTSIEDALEPCERYRALIEEMNIETPTDTLKITASWGITSFMLGVDDANSLMLRADKALYQAKEKGRNRIDIL